MHIYLYEGNSESNASCFIMLAHNIRGWCQWDGSRGWTFPPKFQVFVRLPSDSLTKWCLTWKCGWSECMAPTDSHWHLLTFLKTNQWMWAQWGVRWCAHSSGLVHIFMSAVFRLLFTADKNAKMHAWWWQLRWKVMFCSLKFALSRSATVLFWSV